MTEENFIDFKCPSCGAPTSFLDSVAGTAQECPSCQESLIVPRESAGVGGRVPIPLSTPRLVLRRLRGADWKDLLELTSDEVFQHLETEPMDEEGILRWLEADGSVRLTTPGQPFHLGLEAHDAGKLIGYASFAYHDLNRRQAGVDLLLDRRCHRQGYGTEALGALLDFGFRGVGLHRVTAFCDTRNLAACRLFEKAGLRREGEFRQDRFVKGQWVNTACYALLREEYDLRTKQSYALGDEQ